MKVSQINTSRDTLTFWAIVKLIAKDRAVYIHDPTRPTDPQGVEYSRLVERALVCLPNPPLAAIINPDGVLKLHDKTGLLHALTLFYSNELRLTGLQLAKELEGCTYSDLIPMLKNRIDDYPFTVYRIFSYESELKKKMFLEAI